MDVTTTMGAADLLRRHLEKADPDLLRSTAKGFGEVLMNAEAEQRATGLYL